MVYCLNTLSDKIYLFFTKLITDFLKVQLAVFQRFYINFFFIFLFHTRQNSAFLAEAVRKMLVRGNFCQVLLFARDRGIHDVAKAAVHELGTFV